MPPRIAHALNHIGVSVPDIDAAIAWYGRIFGFAVIAEPAEVPNDGSHFAKIAGNICGPSFKGMKIAHMVTADGAGFELFEFPGHERRDDTMEYWKNGFFHIGFTDPDVEGKVKEIVEAGGVQRSDILTLFPDEDIRVCYCEDPFGNVIEILSHRYEHALANRG